MANFYNEENGIYYIDDVATTLDYEGFGTWNSKRYENGVILTGWRDGNSNDGDYYVDGVYVGGLNGWWFGTTYYYDNDPTTLDSNGSGFWSDKAYYYGSEQPNGWNDYFWYIDNVETTLDNEGNGEWNGQTYVNGVVQGGGGGSVNLESGLQAFYKLSDTSDSSGNGRTLTNNGGVSFASGKLGNAASFDGSNQLQVVNPIAEGTEYSLAGWVKFSNFDSLQYIMSFGGDMGVLYHNGVEPAEVIFTPTGGAYIGVGTPSANDWHFIYASRKANGDYAISIDNGALVTGNAGENYYGTFEIGNLLNGSIDAVGIWSRSLTESEITELYNSGTGLELEVPNLTSGLQAFYKLSDTSDSSGNNRTLTNNGNVSFASGKLGNAAVFDGSNYLSNAANIQPFINNDWTITCWIKADANNLGSYAPIFADEANNLALQFQETIYFQTMWGVDNSFIASNVALDNTWQFVTVKKQNGTVYLYVNSNLEGSRAMEMPQGGTELRIANNGDANANLIGSIDAVGIWNRALNSAEVAALYNNGAGLELGTTPTLNTLTKIQGNAKFYGKVKFVG